MNFFILLVDDDPIVREETREILHEYNVLEVSEGKAACKLLRKIKEVRLVLLDVLLPDVNGLTLINQFRKINPHVAIVVYTAYGTKDTVLDALRGHADNFIEKSCAPEELRAIVGNILAHRHVKGCSERPSDINQLKQIMEYLDSHCEEMISLKEVASRLNITPKYLSRIFREKTGRGFTDYRLQCKINQAKRLLQKNQTVEEIAFLLGYKNTESFIRLFKKREGITPARFRAKYKMLKFKKELSKE